MNQRTFCLLLRPGDDIPKAKRIRFLDHGEKLTSLNPSSNGHQNGDAKADKTAKKMHFITFYPMLAARENGVTIPDVSPFNSLPIYSSLPTPEGKLLCSHFPPSTLLRRPLLMLVLNRLVLNPPG
jgi:hypothetical protein